MEETTQPVVLCLSGLDPSGGAGIQADIETLASLGCHCAPIVTTLTLQDSCNVIELVAVDPALIGRQIALIFADMPVSVVKIGLLGSAELVEPIITQLKQHPHVPVILDPVLKASGGTELANQQIITAIREQLLPNTFLITPNSHEAQQLCPIPNASHEQIAHYLHSLGCKHVLITGGDCPGSNVINQLYSEGEPMMPFQWPRLEGSFHGSGCTLASAISGFLAKKPSISGPVFDTVFKAQKYTHGTLAAAQPLGKGQLIPIRVPAS